MNKSISLSISIRELKHPTQVVLQYDSISLSISIRELKLKCVRSRVL